MNTEIAVIAHNIRSAHNVGSLLRSADGLGIQTVYLSGYTPYPSSKHDTRLPHLSRKIHAAIQKTALGAEHSQSWEHIEDIRSVLKQLKQRGYTLIGLEQAENAVMLPKLRTPSKAALVLGSELEGIDTSLLADMDIIVEIPMLGNKESFNVVSAANMALYHMRFIDMSI